MPQGNADQYGLERFVSAQESTFEQARSELRAGRKRSHWMWFIFPQIRGLGSSPTAQRFALSGQDEADAYLDHPLLGPRLRECTSLVNQVTQHSVHEIFGYPDDLKFHSSVTLFAQAAQRSGRDAIVFTEALDLHFGGRMDEGTLRLLGR